MRSVCVLALMVCGVAAISTTSEPVITKEFVDSLNAKKGMKWTAGLSNGPRVDNADRAALKRLMGVRNLGKPSKLPMREFTLKELATPIPDSFDSAAQWPNCPTITHIRDQSDCGSCWAVAGAEAMSDRYCTTAGIPNLEISAANLMECCYSCGNGCNGGEPNMAWDFWVSQGLFADACQPYPFPKCAHHTTTSPYPECGKTEYPTPPCSTTCNGNTTSKYNNLVRHKGKTAYALQSVESFQRELMAHGPFEVAFSVYADFMTYKSGVYERQSNDFMGGHAVRIVGWGTLNGTPYWKIANSWNKSWGLDGYFLILRGQDECGIEDAGSAGLALN